MVAHKSIYGLLSTEAKRSPHGIRKAFSRLPRKLILLELLRSLLCSALCILPERRDGHEFILRSSRDQAICEVCPCPELLYNFAGSDISFLQFKRSDPLVSAIAQSTIE